MLAARQILTAVPMQEPIPPSDDAASARGPGLPAIPPDAMESDPELAPDEIIPSRGYESLPMVALGGSAGCIEALKRFLEQLPPDPGMAFVVILHLSPDFESKLPEILQSSSAIPVRTAEDGQKVEVNHVYVIPPGKYLTARDGRLQLTPAEPSRGRRVAVDLFFRSLADTHGPHAIAVVLSGADSDGSIGLRRVKERGGLTIAQDPDEAEHEGMPRSALATGMVDWVLRVEEMPGKILDYRRREASLRLPPEESPGPRKGLRQNCDEDESALRDTLLTLRSLTGRDFSYYKRATIVRRIARRLQVNGLRDLSGYHAFLRTHPGEAGALLQDLLISVTNFFRDRESFEALEKDIPRLFEGKGPVDSVRVWVPACATGEEAYSIAMLLLEHASSLESPPHLQVFGCDLDEEAIQKARSALYPETIVADVSTERLRRFFVHEQGSYRIKREVREVVLFATHDLLKDAPFSRMDLISCRNLLIYLNRHAQKRALETFHFALRPQGLLFLGMSESADEETSLFLVHDKTHRLYLRTSGSRTSIPLPESSATLRRAMELQATLRPGPTLPGPGFALPAAPAKAPLDFDEGTSPVPLHLRLIELLAPPSVLVNEALDLVHISANAGRFFEVPGGEPSTNLLDLVQSGLRSELRAAIFSAVEFQQQVEVTGLELPAGGEGKVLDITVLPATGVAPGYLLVTFAEREARENDGNRPPRVEGESVVRHLERELEQVHLRLRETIERSDANTEDLQASNEELQAMNEELRSATEELETSREELQSINEELTTVNQELKSKVDELGQVNSDLQNLMASTDIATVFLDRGLHIMRYTPAAIQLFNLIPGDMGRPLVDLKFRADYPEFTGDAERVLQTLVPIDREIKAAGDRWYHSRLLPYRTLDDRIAGVVLTLFDVTERRRAEINLRERNEELERFNKAAVNREVRMIELKREVNDALRQSGKAPRYREDSLVVPAPPANAGRGGGS